MVELIKTKTAKGLAKALGFRQMWARRMNSAQS